MPVFSAADRSHKVVNMCGRFTLRTNLSLIARQFQLQSWEEAPPRYNIAPETMIACVREFESKHRELVYLRWGLIPSWAQDPTIGRKLINARGESVASKPSFRNAFRSRRCLVLADGFYEWKREGKKKQPMYIRLRDEQPFAFAGLWEHWTGNGLTLETCTIITTDANELLKPVHDRMPVILDPADLDDWLDPQSERSLNLLRPFPSERMMVTPVSDFVNKATQDSPQCIAPLEKPRQQTLFD